MWPVGAWTARWLSGWMWWIVLPAFCVATFLLSVVTLVQNSNDPPIGVPGTFTVTSNACVNRVCSVLGDYQSDDGAIVRFDVLGDQRWASGTHRAYYDGGAPDALAAQHSWDPTTALLAAGGSLVYLITIGWLGLAEWRRSEVSSTLLVPRDVAREEG